MTLPTTSPLQELVDHLNAHGTRATTITDWLAAHPAAAELARRFARQAAEPLNHIGHTVTIENETLTVTYGEWVDEQWRPSDTKTIDNEPIIATCDDCNLELDLHVLPITD